MSRDLAAHRRILYICDFTGEASPLLHHFPQLDFVGPMHSRGLTRMVEPTSVCITAIEELVLDDKPNPPFEGYQSHSSGIQTQAHAIGDDSPLSAWSANLKKKKVHARSREIRLRT